MDEMRKDIEISSGAIILSHFRGVSEVGGIYNEPALNGIWRLCLSRIEHPNAYDYFEVIHKDFLNESGTFIGEWKLHDKKIAIPNNLIVFCDFRAMGGNFYEEDDWQWQSHERIDVKEFPEISDIIWMYKRWNQFMSGITGFVLRVLSPSESKYDLYIVTDKEKIIAVKVFFKAS